MTQKDSRVRRLTPKKMKFNSDGLIALKKMEKYEPQRKEYNLEHLAKLQAALAKTHEEEVNAVAALSKARDAAVAMEWAAHDFFQGAIEAVIGQFGANSDEYASLGFKKKKEYKKATHPKRKA